MLKEKTVLKVLADPKKFAMITLEKRGAAELDGFIRDLLFYLNFPDNFYLNFPDNKEKEKKHD